MISSNYLFGAGGGEGGGDLEDFSGGGGHKVFSGNLGGGEMSLPTEYKIDCQLTAGVIGISPSFMGGPSKYHRDTTKNPGPLPPLLALNNEHIVNGL